jgi:hypothetical protein
MSGDFSANLYQSVHSGAESANARDFLRLSTRSALISITQKNVEQIRLCLRDFLLTQITDGTHFQRDFDEGRLHQVGDADISGKLDILALAPGKTLLVQQEQDGSVSLSAAPVGQKVTLRTTADGGRELLAVRPRVAQASLSLRSKWHTQGKVEGYEQDPVATAAIVRVTLQANHDHLSGLRPLTGEEFALSRVTSTSSAVTRTETMRKDASDVDEAAMDIAILASSARFASMQKRALVVSGMLMARGSVSCTVDDEGAVSKGEFVETNQQMLLVDRAFVDIQENFNGLKDSIESAKAATRATLTGERAIVPAHLRDRINTLSRAIDEELVTLNTVYESSCKPMLLSRAQNDHLRRLRSAILGEAQRYCKQYGLLERFVGGSEGVTLHEAVEDALDGGAQLFLQKLRHRLLMRLTGQLRDLNEGLFSNLVTDFVWLYAGLKRVAGAETSPPRHIGFVLAKGSPSPGIAIIDDEKLFNHGDRLGGLSRLGYEFAFLRAAGCQVGCATLDLQTGLTKIYFELPTTVNDNFDTLLRRCALIF